MLREDAEAAATRTREEAPETWFSPHQKYLQRPHLKSSTTRLTAAVRAGRSTAASIAW